MPLSLGVNINLAPLFNRILACRDKLQDLWKVITLACRYICVLMAAAGVTIMHDMNFLILSLQVNTHTTKEFFITVITK